MVCSDCFLLDLYLYFTLLFPKLFLEENLVNPHYLTVLGVNIHVSRKLFVYLKILS